MKSNTFYAPKTIQELVELLKMKKERNDLYLVAGATDLAIHIKKQGILHFATIDLTHMDELKEIEKKDDVIEIGAAVTMTKLEKSIIIQVHGYALAGAAGRVGSTQIRNRATIGGNIANAAHCADTITACFALGATAVLLDSEGVFRELPLEEFVLGLGETQIKPDEALVNIRIPKGSTSIYSSFSKVGSRKNVTISKLNHAVRLVFKDNYVTEAAMYFGSIGPKPIKALNIEKHCIDREWNEALLLQLLDLGSKLIDEAIPTRTSRHYKRIAIKGVISDVFNDILSQREVI
ncbi:FAD-binding protein [Alkaliphilus pronyensis]|uniref:FAD-binding protein n=1 Tax=Alkaliphilus pronyensis TaxID=1482732 RepID=A0A6I0FD79_9FIRM|nr:FAD binding domain-containing protein [Alkaliphilus pronyensis]KAB3532127.1 FAD-binding protein [Alkaliphilus pronyensis]